jgi:hypothetical protein
VDHVAALIDYLKADSAIQAAVGVNGTYPVFDEEIPDQIIGLMPMPVIVVMMTPGSRNFGGPTNDFSDKMVDVRAYAADVPSARALEVKVYDCLRNMRTNRRVGTLLHFARAAGSPQVMRSQQITWPGGVVDSTTHWPYVWRAWQVMSADIPVLTS